jgi:hypothetical protein
LFDEWIMCFVTLYHLQCLVILNDVSSEVERIGEEVVMLCLNVLYFLFPGGTEENHEKSQ